MRTYTITALFAVLLITACTTGNIFGPRSPHAAYADRLEKAGLGNSALGKKWFAAAEKSLSDSFPVKLPYLESGYFAADIPQSVCVRFSAKKGQRVVASVQARPADKAQLFAEIWSPARGRRKPKLLAAADSTLVIRYEPDDGEEMLFRLQPELLVDVSYTLTIVAEPTLAFPVPGNDGKRVGSFWGDARDDGKRKHEGIDIFDRFRTPVIAAHDGIVTRVHEGGIGGKVVWLNPSGKSYSLYYAHLDSQIARPLQRVNKGDTLGLMGNTGNAKYTPTHLHFGIYEHGAVDPLPFVQQVKTEPEKIRSDLSLLNETVRTASKQALLFTPEKKQRPVALIEKHTLLRVTGATGNYLRIRLPDDTEGFIYHDAADKVATSLKTIRLNRDSELLASPQAGAAVIRTINEMAEVNAHAYFGDYAFVAYDGIFGWIQRDLLK